MPLPTIYECVMAVARRALRSRAGADRELAGGIRQRDPRRARVRDRRGADRRRGRAPDHAHADRQDAASAGADRARAVPSPGQRPVREVPARAAGPGRGHGRPEHRRRGPDRRRVRPALGRARQPHLRRAVRLRGAGRPRRGHARERDPLRLAGARAARTARSAYGSGGVVQDLDRLLGPARSPRRARRRAAGVRRRARSTSARSSRDRASRASGATCSSPTSPAGPTTRRSSRRCEAIGATVETLRVLGCYPSA